MTGRKLFDKYQEKAWASKPGSPEWDYGQTLRTALRVVGDDLYSALDKAEQSGKKIGLTYPIPIKDGYSDPSGIELI